MESKGFAFRCGKTLYYYTEGKDGKPRIYTLITTRRKGVFELVICSEAKTPDFLPSREYWEILPQFKLGWLWCESNMRLTPILYDWEQTSERSRLGIVKSLDDYLSGVNGYMGTDKLFTILDGLGMVRNEGERVHFDRFRKVLEGLV